MEEKRKLNPVIIAVGAVILVIVLALVIRSCVVPSEAEQATMTSVAVATQSIMETKVAALTSVVAKQTEGSHANCHPTSSISLHRSWKFYGNGGRLRAVRSGVRRKHYL